MDRLEPRLHALLPPRRTPRRSTRPGRSSASSRTAPPAARCAACRSASRTSSPSPGCRCPAARRPTATSCPTRTTSSSSACAPRARSCSARPRSPSSATAARATARWPRRRATRGTSERTSGGSSAGLGRRGRRGDGPRRDRRRRRRLDPHPGVVLRAVRDEGVDGARPDVPVAAATSAIPASRAGRASSTSGPSAAPSPTRALVLSVIAGPDAARPPLDPGGRRRLARRAEPGDLRGLRVAFSADLGRRRGRPRGRAGRGRGGRRVRRARLRGRGGRSRRSPTRAPPSPP